MSDDSGQTTFSIDADETILVSPFLLKVAKCLWAFLPLRSFLSQLEQLCRSMSGSNYIKVLPPFRQPEGVCVVIRPFTVAERKLLRFIYHCFSLCFL